MSAPNAIIALSELELADFFPGSLRAELAALLPGAEWVHPPFAASNDWVRLWLERPAEILVSAWQTPPLNGPLAPADLNSLKYVCYVAGSVRKLVPRELIERGVVA